MAITFIRGLHNLPPPGEGVAATIGTFDGVHRGHQAILARVRERASHLGVPACAIIFEPHPREYFLGPRAPAKLMRLREKVEALDRLGIDRVLCLPFNERLRSMNPETFIEEVLVAGLGVRSLVVGDDFRFGRSGSGNAALLRAAAARWGFEVLDTPTVYHQGRRISSTWVREALEAGDFDLAAALLGRRYGIGGRVMRGEALGRRLGVPTANVNLKRQRAPLSGVFVVEAVVEGRRFPAVANVGVRPTLGGSDRPILEVHLLDWQGDLYGKRLWVEFLARLRDEARFPDLERLAAQIESDVRAARAFFARRGSPGTADDGGA
ncbi:MAG: riboflavin biosynthesis protein [Porticoccaceae bacterium]|nr:MAG: riboflavin biosynthesis protein [Porticoccaceae bacterium]